MKLMKRTISAVLVLCLCTATLAGCGKRKEPTPQITPSPQATAPVTTENTMGLISYVSDSYIAVTEYTADRDILNFSDFDSANVSGTDQTRYIAVTKSTQYRSTAGADMMEISKDDLSVGDFITAATVDGVLQITRLATADGTSDYNATTDGALDGWPQPTPDITPMIDPVD